MVALITVNAGTGGQALPGQPLIGSRRQDEGYGCLGVSPGLCIDEGIKMDGQLADRTAALVAIIFTQGAEAAGQVAEQKEGSGGDHWITSTTLTGTTSVQVDAISRA